VVHGLLKILVQWLSCRLPGADDATSWKRRSLIAYGVGRLVREMDDDRYADRKPAYTTMMT
jgi:hypothetical protein